METKYTYLDRLIQANTDQYEYCIKCYKESKYLNNKLYWVKQAIATKRLLNEAIANRGA